MPENAASTFTSWTNKSGVAKEPWMFPDSNFQEIVHEALYYTESRPFDLIFLCAGIYNFISKDTVTGEFSFPWNSSEKLILSLLQMVDEADRRFTKERPATKVIYCPIMGANLDIILHREAKLEQTILNEGIWALKTKFFELNNKRGYYSQNLIAPVHRIIKGKRKYIYHHLQTNGLELTEARS